MTLAIWGVVAILLLLILMKLPATTNLLLSPMKPTSERRSGKDRRQSNVPVRVNRRRRPRRFEDQAQMYADSIARKQHIEDSKSP
jgi:hypothetical protein